MAHERWTPLRVEPTKTNESRVHVWYPQDNPRFTKSGPHHV